MSVILFDGECTLCNRFVSFTIDRDPAQRFRFASLQSDAGQKILADAGISADMSTLFLADGEKLHQRSSASLRICRGLKFPWPLLSVFLIVPPFLRDFVYRWVSRNRYNWFGRETTCRVPTAEERERFVQ